MGKYLVFWQVWPIIEQEVPAPAGGWDTAMSWGGKVGLREGRARLWSVGSTGGMDWERRSWYSVTRLGATLRIGSGGTKIGKVCRQPLFFIYLVGGGAYVSW